MALRRFVAERLRLLRLLPGGGVAAVAGLTVTHLAEALVPATQAITAGHLLAEAANPGGRGGLLVAVAALGTVLLVGHAAEGLRTALQSLVAQRINGRIRGTVRRLATTQPGLARLESTAFQDDAYRAADLGSAMGRTRSPGTAAVGQLTLLFRMFAALAAAAVLAAFSAVLATALLITSLTVRAILRRQWTNLIAVIDARVAEQRKVWYWAELATGVAAKEVRVFRLADWLGNRYRAAAYTAFGPAWREQWRVLRRQWWIAALVGGSAAAALGVPAAAAYSGRIGADQLVTYILAAWGIFGISTMGQEAFDIEYGRTGVAAMDRLTARHRSAPPTSGGPAAAAGGPPLVRFEDVAFAYPGARRPVLDGLCLTLRPGERVAVVGENGAGKTTFVKLLAGLYQPAAGRITVAGTDLADLDPLAWRRRVTAVFQDFVRYPVSLADNVAMAAPERAADPAAMVAAVHAAIQSAGLAGLVADLPDGLDTLLWPEGSGGTDLSGGQWQRIALARALFAVAAGRQLVILDEPTAHLDVRAETAFHELVIGALGAVTTVLISHRLSTVRPADRIALLRGGRVAEEGTHDELIRQGGEYARLFQLQAGIFV